MKTVNLADKFAQFDAAWTPKIAGQVNDMHLKLAKFRGVEHCPGAVGDECHVVLLEPSTTVNTGDGGDTALTVRDLEEI
jgi:hypothetical protein